MVYINSPTARGQNNCILLHKTSVFVGYRFKAVQSITEDNGNNVLHLLAKKISLVPESEEKLVKTYIHLTKILSTNLLHDMLLYSNQSGFHPLEYAVVLNAYDLAQEMLKTPLLYLVREIHDCGMVHRWYDITRYETVSVDCMTTSFLSKRNLCYDLLFLSQQNIENDSTKRIYNSAFFKTYLQKKVQITSIFSIMWFLFRLHYILIFTFYTICGKWGPGYSYESANATIRNTGRCFTWFFSSVVPESAATNAIAVYMFVLSGLMLTVDLTDALKVVYNVLFDDQAYTVYRLVRRKPLAVYYNSGKLYHTMATFCIFVLFFNEILRSYVNYNILGFVPEQIIYILATVKSLNGILTFLQLFRDIHWFWVVFERLMQDFNPFLVYLTIFYIVPQGILNLRYSLMFEDFREERQTTFWSSFYSTIHFYLGGYDYNDFKAREQFVFAFIELYMVITSLIAMNFVIAIFANTVSHVMKNKQVISTAQKISYLFAAEKRFRRFPVIAKLCTVMARRVFDTEEDKVLLHVCELE